MVCCVVDSNQHQLSFPDSSVGRALAYGAKCRGFESHLGQVFFPFSIKRVFLGTVDLCLGIYLVEWSTSFWHCSILVVSNGMAVSYAGQRSGLYTRVHVISPTYSLYQLISLLGTLPSSACLSVPLCVCLCVYETDVDECELGKDNCDQICSVDGDSGWFNCSCRDGFFLSQDGHTCTGQ